MLSDLCIIHPRAQGHWARHGHSCKSHLCLSLSAHSAQAVHSPAEDTQSPSSHSPNAFQLLPHSGNFCQHEVGCHKRKNSKIKIVEPKNHLKLKRLVRCLERLFQGNAELVLSKSGTSSHSTVCCSVSQPDRWGALLSWASQLLYSTLTYFWRSSSGLHAQTYLGSSTGSNLVRHSAEFLGTHQTFTTGEIPLQLVQFQVCDCLIFWVKY